VQLGRTPENTRADKTSVSRELDDLRNLFEKGIVTNSEFVELTKRIISVEKGPQLQGDAPAMFESGDELD
jgi:hypothetical protein